MKLQLSGGEGGGGYPVSQRFLIGYVITLQVILVMVRVQIPGPPGQLRQCNVVNLFTICLLRTFRLSYLNVNFQSVYLSPPSMLIFDIPLYNYGHPTE